MIPGKYPEFLTGRRLPLEHLAEGSAAPDFSPAERSEAAEPPTLSETPAAALGPLTVYRRRAMAGDFEITVNDPCRMAAGSADADPAAAALAGLDEIDRIEELLSVFRPTSPVSRINALAAEMDVGVSGELFSLLETCRRLAEETGGAFDITVSPLWKVWGFARRDGRLPTDDALREALSHVGMNHLRLFPERLAVGLDDGHSAVNFGGIGKGYALDRAAEVLERGGLTDFLAHGGMSSVLARGRRVGEEWENGKGYWSIGVVHPLRPEERLGTIRLSDAALATSGSARQFFLHRGERLSHIIDPRNGRPATGVLSATVIAENAAEADALSTAFFVMGPEKTEEFCENRPDLAVLFVLEKRTGETAEIRTIHLDDNLFSAAAAAARRGSRFALPRN